MTTPIVIDVPHNLGREEVRRRMEARVGELPNHIPGGMARVHSEWRSPDVMLIDVAAMGQTIATQVAVEDTNVKVSLILPPALSFMAGPIAAIVRNRGRDLLLDDKSRR